MRFLNLLAENNLRQVEMVLKSINQPKPNSNYNSYNKSKYNSNDEFNF